MSQPLGIVHICWRQVRVDVHRIAWQRGQIDLAAEQVQHPALVGEQGADPSQIAGGIAAIIASLHPIVVPHDPGAYYATILCHEQAAWEACCFDVASYSILPVHSAPLP